MAKHFIALGRYTAVDIYAKDRPFEIIGRATEPRVALFGYENLPEEICGARVRTLEMPGFFTDHSKDVSADMLLHWMRRNGRLSFNGNAQALLGDPTTCIDKGVQGVQQLPVGKDSQAVEMSFCEIPDIMLDMRFTHLYVDYLKRYDTHVHMFFLPSYVSLTSVKNIFDDSQARLGVIIKSGLSWLHCPPASFNQAVRERLYEFLDKEIPQDNAWLKRKENQ